MPIKTDWVKKSNPFIKNGSCTIYMPYQILAGYLILIVKGGGRELKE